MAYHLSRTSSSDYLSWPTMGRLSEFLDGANKVSWGMWVKFYSLTNTTANDNVVFRCFIKVGLAQSGAGLVVNCSNGTTNVVKTETRSSLESPEIEVTTTSVVTTGVWTHLGVMLDYAADSVSLYFNGVPDTPVGAVAYFLSAYTDQNDQTNTDGFSSNGATAEHHPDADIAEMGLWTRDIGLIGFQQLAAGLSPMLVWQNRLISYTPLENHTRDLIIGDTLTITGSVPIVEHPPIIREVLPRVNQFSRRARRRA